MNYDHCRLFVHNLTYFSFFFCKAIYSKIYLNKFKLHHLYMYLYLCVWINLYNNNNIFLMQFLIKIDLIFEKQWKDVKKTNLFLVLTLFLLGGRVNLTPPCSFLHNSKSVGLRRLKFSDFSYIPKALPLGLKPGFNTNCLSPQANCLNDCFCL